MRDGAPLATRVEFVLTLLDATAPVRADRLTLTLLTPGWRFAAARAQQAGGAAEDRLSVLPFAAAAAGRADEVLEHRYAPFAAELHPSLRVWAVLRPPERRFRASLLRAPLLAVAELRDRGTLVATAASVGSGRRFVAGLAAELALAAARLRGAPRRGDAAD